MSTSTIGPTPRGPEDERTGDDDPKASEREEKDRKQPKQRDRGEATPPPLDKPATPDANPIDPRIFQGW